MVHGAMVAHSNNWKLHADDSGLQILFHPGGGMGEDHGKFGAARVAGGDSCAMVHIKILFQAWLHPQEPLPTDASKRAGVHLKRPIGGQEACGEGSKKDLYG